MRIKYSLLFFLLTMCLSPILAKSEEVEYGIVRLSTANIRSEANHASELISQALCGTPLKINEIKGEWCLVELPDGYQGYIHHSSISAKTADEMERWRDAERVIVMSPTVIEVLNDTVAVHPSMKGSYAVSDLTGGCIVEKVYDSGNFSLVKFPDGREGFVENIHICDIKDWANQGTDIWICISTAEAMNGIPYLWGGMSPKGVDCSGLVRAAYFSTGIILRRDASQQALTGIDIPASRPDLWQKGDLLFFKSEESGKVTHVALYKGNGEFIHSSGMVRNGSIEPDSRDYFDKKVSQVSRITGAEGTVGIIRVKDHSWYFNSKE